MLEELFNAEEAKKLSEQENIKKIIQLKRELGMKPQVLLRKQLVKEKLTPALITFR